MTTYLTADNHFWHARILGYCGRPFASTWEMNEAMVERWNEVVRPEDEVRHLGDFCLASFEWCRRIFERLNGRKHLILGNHDGSLTRMRRMGWETVEKSCWLGDLFLVHDSYDVGPLEKVVCGHVHEKWKKKLRGTTRVLNVGVDVWNFTPVRLELVQDILDNENLWKELR